MTSNTEDMPLQALVGNLTDRLDRAEAWIGRLAGMNEGTTFLLAQEPSEHQLRVVWVSQELERLTRYRSDELQALSSLTEVVHPADRLAPADLRRLSSGEMIQRRARLILPDGTLLPVAYILRPLRSRPLLLAGAIRKLDTPLPQHPPPLTALRLQSALAQCARLLLNAPAQQRQQTLDAVLDELRRAVRASRGVLLLAFQQTPTGSLACPLSEALAVGQLSVSHTAQAWPLTIDADEVLYLTLSGGQPVTGPVGQVLAAHHALREWCEARNIGAALSVPVFVGGKLWGALICADIDPTHTWDAAATQMFRTAGDMIVGAVLRWDAADALRASEELVRVVGQLGRMGAWSLSLPGLQLRCSEPAAHILDLRSGVVLSLRQALAFAPRGARRQLLRALARPTPVGEPFSAELAITTALGRHIWIEIQCQPVSRTSGPTPHLFGTLQDTTERHRQEEQRIESARIIQNTRRMESIGVLAGGIAHDFNNLLAAIMGHAELALHSLPAETSLRFEIETILSSARRGADLTNQLLAYAGRGHYLNEPVDLKVLLNHVHQHIPLVIAKSCTVNYAFTAETAFVYGDANQLHQLVHNLLLNAAEAMQQHGGVIGLSLDQEWLDERMLAQLDGSATSAPGQFVRLTVDDHGVGMDAATLSRAFEPFFSTKFAGRGLGLAAAQGIVLAHNGLITLRSEQERGTCATVWLPAYNAIS